MSIQPFSFKNIEEIDRVLEWYESHCSETLSNEQRRGIKPKDEKNYDLYHEFIPINKKHH